MSEYQYYEFLAVDRPLGESDRQALRALSSRAKISTTQFVNSYNWGDFHGDPAKLMEQWFDLHLYFANWGTRRLMLRVPKAFVDLPALGWLFDQVEEVTVQEAGDHLIFDLLSEDEDYDGLDDEDWEDGAGLAALAPLRADLIAGDLRLFYLLWLTAVEFGAVDDDVLEPLAWSGPLTAPLQAFADFFRIDRDLVQAAVENGVAGAEEPPAGVVEAAVANLPDEEKNALLLRLFNADPYVGAELRRLLRRCLQQDETASCSSLRTAGALRARADEVRHERLRAEAEAAAAKRRKEAEAAEKQRRLRTDALAKRGEAVWREIETEINRRNSPGYAAAVTYLLDLEALGRERGLTADFKKRVTAIRDRHVQKRRLIERMTAAGLYYPSL